MAKHGGGHEAAAYRLMLWQYRLQDLLHLDPPEPHLAQAPIRPGMTVVDYGCGPGRYAVPLAQRVGPSGKVYAVDIQPLAIEAVRKRIARAGLANVEPILVDSYRTPIAADSVDLVVLLDTFHAIGDRPALLQEIHRLLKPDGLLFMDPGHMPMAEAREAVEGSGLFRVKQTDGKHMLVEPMRGKRGVNPDT
ncbi:MAG: class I SAM-dependent methyltransferase [Anaerolineae bacterium]|nr:class I SAM-dependent methyltransferase [Anaerolineae bacterium]